MKTEGGRQTHDRLAHAGIPFRGTGVVHGHWNLRIFLKRCPLAVWWVCLASRASRAVGEEE